jgi:membrane-associated phospholipid phosphatase
MLVLALSVLLAASTPPDPPGASPARPRDPAAETSAAPRSASVYRVGKVDLAITVLAAGAAIAPGRIMGPVIRRTCPCEPGSVNAFDRVAIDLDHRAADVASDLTVALAVLTPAIADAFWVGLSPAFREDLLVLTETLAVNAAVVMTVKYQVQRPLPATFAGRDGLVEQAQGYRSFYSGHTSTAVAALTAAAWTIHLRHGPSAWPWLAVGAVGVSVAVERVLAGRHWPTDVLVGAGAGLAVGTLVPLLHARRPPWRRGHLSVTPAPAGHGLALAGAF